MFCLPRVCQLLVLKYQPQLITHEIHRAHICLLTSTSGMCRLWSIFVKNVLGPNS